VRERLPISLENNRVLQLENLGFAYGEIGLFGGLNVGLEKGEVRVVLGPSGSGKTTLLHLIAGLLPIQQGDILWQGASIKGQSEESLARQRLSFMGLIFQHHYLQAELSALENILIPGYLADQVDTGWGKELLSRVGLGERAHLLPKALSGGERQRVAVARALYNRPKLLLADEPTGSLDRKNAERVLKLMLELAQAIGTSLILATHDEHLIHGLPELRLGG